VNISVLHKVLVAAFNGAPLSRKQKLTSTYAKNDALPILVWQVGSWKESDWTPGDTRMTWTIPAKLTVRSEQDNPQRLLEVISDIQDWVDAIQGLPLDKDNHIIPNFGDQVERLRKGEIVPVMDRFAGPTIASISVPPSTGGDVYTADFTFQIDFTREHPQPGTYPIRQFVLGMQPMDPAYKSIGYDPNKPFELQLPLAEDPEVYSRTPYAEPDTIIRTADGNRLYGSFPPLLREYQAVKGVDPATTMLRMDVLPAAFTLSAGSPTLKCSAIGYFMDGGTARLDSQATWQTSAPLVATVGSDGTVTRVGAGTATITATYNGISNTASATVS